MTEVRQQVTGFAENPEVAERLKILISDKIAAPGTEEWMLRKLEEIRDRVLAALEQERENGGRGIVKLYRWTANMLRDKEDMMAAGSKGRYP